MIDTRIAKKTKAGRIINRLRARGMCEDAVASKTCKIATRLARTDGHDLRALCFDAREDYYLAAVFELGAEILGT